MLRWLRCWRTKADSRSAAKPAAPLQEVEPLEELVRLLEEAGEPVSDPVSRKKPLLLCESASSASLQSLTLHAGHAIAIDAPIIISGAPASSIF